MATPPPPPPREPTVRVRLPTTEGQAPTAGFPVEQPTVLHQIHDKLDFLITRDSVRFEPRLAIVERKSRELEDGFARWRFGVASVVLLSFGAGVLGAFVGRLLQ